VLRDHTPSLLQIPGVVGTAETLLRGKPAILIMVSILTPETAQKIPRRLEGYPVKVEETGGVKAR
jgi:hypothetical protein